MAALGRLVTVAAPVTLVLEQPARPHQPGDACLADQPACLVDRRVALGLRAGCEPGRGLVGQPEEGGLADRACDSLEQLTSRPSRASSGSGRAQTVVIVPAPGRALVGSATLVHGTPVAVGSGCGAGRPGWSRSRHRAITLS